MTKHTDTSRSGNLVERLRERNSYGEILLCHPPRPAPDRLCHEAADRIEALEAENERLNSLINDTANHWLDLQHDHPIAWEGAVDAAMEAACDEIRRLSAALGEKQ